MFKRLPLLPPSSLSRIPLREIVEGFKLESIVRVSGASGGNVACWLLNTLGQSAMGRN